jgi:ribonuclease BN (tRNA processing enzyme)
VPDHIVEQCRDVDVLIHDAQYDAAEFEVRRDWGHCTPEYALELALRCRARRLVLYHHDPTHTDRWIDDTVARIQCQAGLSLDVIGAREHLQLTSPAGVVPVRSYRTVGRASRR